MTEKVVESPALKRAQATQTGLAAQNSSLTNNSSSQAILNPEIDINQTVKTLQRQHSSQQRSQVFHSVTQYNTSNRWATQLARSYAATLQRTQQTTVEPVQLNAQVWAAVLDAGNASEIIAHVNPTLTRIPVLHIKGHSEPLFYYTCNGRYYLVKPGGGVFASAHPPASQDILQIEYVNGVANHSGGNAGDTGNAPAKVTTIEGYVRLVQALESKTHWDSRTILAFLRQLYYGKPWSAKARTSDWDTVIPGSINFGTDEGNVQQFHPEVRGLLQALRDSQVIWTPAHGDVDIGHVFAGVESMRNNAEEVTLHRSVFSWTVHMTPEAFATWGGDLGQAVAYKVYDETKNGGKIEDWSNYFGGNDAPHNNSPRSSAGSKAAPERELIGDVEAYSIGKWVSRQDPNRAERPHLTNADLNRQPVSGLLENFYLEPSSTLGQTSRDTYNEFVKALGGQITNKRITNLSQLISTYAPQVYSFAELYYKSEGVAHDNLAGIDSDKGHKYSQEIMGLFLNWLEVRLV